MTELSSPPEPASPSAIELLQALVRLTHILERKHHTSLASHQLSMPRFHLLWVMAQAERLRMSDLADRLDLSARTITSAVDALERDDLLARRPDATDRRATLVELTPAG